jgi:hypothetical protein
VYSIQDIAGSQLHTAWINYYFLYIFGGLECVGYSFAYVAHFVFLRDSRDGIFGHQFDNRIGSSALHALHSRSTGTF